VASPNRYRQRKDENQKDLVSELIAVGCSVYVMHAPADLLVGYRGKTYLFEVKDPNKVPSKRKLTKAQLSFRETWRGHYTKIETSEDAMRDMGVLQ
jgi:hypothetical protein